MANQERSMKEILTAHGFTFKKTLGQNFITDPHICPKMAEASGAEEGVGMLEIGPGIGILTKELAKRASRVVAVELDDRLLPILDETLADYENAKVIHDDAMKVDLDRLVAEEFSGLRVSVCANLPYYITSPVVMRLLESKIPFEQITVMVQKEAADRLCARPGTRDCGAVSLAIAYYAEAKKCFGVPRGCFHPAPNVDSAVISLKLHKNPPVSVKDEKNLFKTVRAAFSQRRKTLSNSLASSLGLPKEQIISAVERVGLAPTVRAENLSLEEFARLSDALFS
ncbi:MAG: 16S rRNA (adenine(1518)-N(6)/adenine(1519)-N(6))-dimethyltransferase RsmA [Oscillospiraceae bacterium]|nr:16S rRNA (adenine(1518)-N(6)/adenine(1519)-N(6))-dimethyltransferase RsmA [Oscillospiraceae bacterium]